MINLFLVSRGCNLLAPSYAGVKQPDGMFCKSSLAGLSITYLAAVDRLVDLYRINGDTVKLPKDERRQKITRDMQPRLLITTGYVVKSIEPSSIQQGVLGQDRYGYLEGVANVNAFALRAADAKTAEAVYRQIAVYANSILDNNRSVQL